MISIRNLTKAYDRSTILENINLEINKGDVVVIVGGSGCGKSTLLRCINRLETATSGEVLIDGQDIQAKDANVEQIRKKLGMVYQSFNLFSHLNVIENIILAPMKVFGLSKEEAIQEAEELLRLVGLENRKYRMPHQLSGGQKQRVAIARAMAMHPEIMLFDEPTSALDPTMVDEVEAVIRRLTNNGMTCLIVTHEMRFAKNIASKVVFLAEKGIYESGDAEEFFNNPKRDLTRQFLYRSRLFEKEIAKEDADIYSLVSDIHKFASNYGLAPRKARGVDYVFDEVILPILRSGDLEKIRVSFIADDLGDDHQMIIEFPQLESDPLKHPTIDELNITLLKGFTRDFASRKNGDGNFEIIINL